MGNYLKTLQGIDTSRQDFVNFLENISLSKLMEYFGLFQAISETYSIDVEEFGELFKTLDVDTQQLFQCLDTDHNLLIDGLELFSALALFSSNIDFVDKVKFIFQLFDFNHLRSLSRTDIQFLILSAGTAVSKLFLTPQEDNFIEEFVHQEFSKDSRVNLSQMIKWATSSASVSTFFTLIGRPFEANPSSLLSKKLYLSMEPHETLQPTVVNRLNSDEQLFLEKSLKLFQESPQDEANPLPRISNLDGYPSWVYGIRFKDVRQFMEVIEGEIVYYVGKIVILYDTKAHRQRFYKGHFNQIISLAVQSSLCASGEYCEQPEIKIWNRLSLQTLNTLRIHTQGVHLLLFLNGLLVSAGCHQESPLFISSIQTGATLFSTYCLWPAVDISPIHNFTSRPTNEFVVATIHSLNHFQVKAKDEQIQVTTTNLRSSHVSRITCVCFYILNSTFQTLSSYDDKVEKCLLAGHENGEITAWSIVNGQMLFTFSNEGNEVVRIIPSHNKLYVASNSSFIRIYHLSSDFAKLIYKIDFTQVNQQLSSYDLHDIKIAPSGLMAITQDAEILLVQDEQGVQRPSLSNLTHHQYAATRLTDILNIEGPINCQKLLKREKEEYLYVTQGHSIRAIDLATHNFCFQWNIGQPITSFDCISARNDTLLIVAATSTSPEESLLCSFNELSENSSRQKVPGEVLSVLLLPDQNPTHILVLISTRNSIHKYNYSRGSFSKAGFIQLGSVSPRLSPLEPNRLLVSSKEKTLQALIVNRQQQQMHLQFNELNSLVSMVPIKVYFQLQSLKQSSEVLPIIISRRSKALVGCRCDGSIDLWKNYEELANQTALSLRAHTYPVKDICFQQDQRFLISAGGQDGMIVQWRTYFRSEINSAVSAAQQPEEIQERSEDKMVSRKIQFCMFGNDLLNDLYDQHLHVSGLKHESIRRLFKATLNDWKSSYRNIEPSLQLRLDFAFGIETFHKNNTILLLEDPKRIVYFIGKIVVIYNPALNNQSFYRGHKFRVTCVALLPDKATAASGEAAFRPIINLWKVDSLETIRVISTCHCWGILDLDVQGTFLLSHGFRQKKEEEEDGFKPLYSFELHDLESGHSLVKGLQQKFVYSFQMDPSNPFRFASCTEGLVTFWQAKASSYRRVNVCRIPQDTPTACLFYPSTSFKLSQPDLLVGTRSGSLGIVSRQKYWHCFQKEERSGQINCLLAVEGGEDTLIVASSEDNMLRVWNSTFEERLSQCLAKEDQSEETKKQNQNNRSLQSLCLLSSKELKIVGGTRNGQVVELWLGRPGNKSRQGEETVLLCFSAGDGTRGRGRALIAHHPKFDVIASVGQDQVVMFWDCDRKKILHTSQLGLERDRSRPTALKFSQGGEHLIIGFSDGLHVFLDSKMSRNGKGDDKYSPIELKTIVKETCEEGWTIVAIEISQGGEFMAISYHKLSQKRSIAEVKIFASKANTHKFQKHNKFQNDKAYEPHSIVDNPHLDHVYQTATGGPCGFAVVSMTFAEYEGSHYLLMLFQLLDQQQNRVGGSEGEEDLKYKIRHVNNKTDSANSSSLNELIRWKKSHLFTALSAQYLLQPTAGPRPPNNHLHLPHFSVANLLEGHLALASDNGDIHLLPVQSVEAGGVATTLPAHSCRVAQLEHNHERTVLYSTGEFDHSILRWVVEPAPHLLSQHLQDDPNDLFAEIPQEEYLASRQIIYHQNFIRPVLPHPASPLRLHDLIGRRAYGIRNNLKTDQRGRLVYHSGQTVVIADMAQKCKEFLFEKGRTLEEVSTIELSEDGELLVAACAGVRPAVVIWGLSAKLQLGKIYLENVMQVVYMALSHNNTRLLAYVLRGKKAEGCLMLIDLSRKQLLATATYLLKPNWHVKALAFAPNSQDNFFTCGVEAVKSWHLHSGQLTSSPLLFSDPLRIHTCLTFAGPQLITGTDQGQLVLWRLEPLLMNAHQQMVTCMAVTKRQNGWLIASGSQASLQEGESHQVIIWALIQGQLKQLQQIIARRDVLTSSMLLGGRGNSRYQSELEVQSLSFGRDRLNIGLLRGDIFSCEVYEEGVRQPVAAKLEMALQDGQSTKAFFFAQAYHQLVDISEHGLLRLWSFPEGNFLWSQHLEGEVVDMVFSSIQGLALIGFRGQLRFFVWGEGRRSLEQIEERAIQFNFLTHLVLNHGEQLVALGIESNSDRSHLIQVYELGQKEFRLRLKMRFDSAIEYIDFNRASNQKSFILIKTQSRLELYDLNSLSEVSNVLALKLDWLGPGLQIVDKTRLPRQIHKELSGELLIKRISELSTATLIVDIAGDVYLFRQGELVGKSNLRVSGAESVAVCSSGRWVGVASRWDRNIVIWDLHQIKS